MNEVFAFYQEWRYAIVYLSVGLLLAVRVVKRQRRFRAPIGKLITYFFAVALAWPLIAGYTLLTGERLL